MNCPRTETEWNNFLEERDIELVEPLPVRVKLKTQVTIRCRKCGRIDRNLRISKLLRRATACLHCAENKVYNTRNIRQIIEENGGLYISGEVKNRDSLVHHNCPGCLRETTKRAHDIRRRPKSCQHCRAELISRTQLERNDNLAKAHRLADERGGECLTTSGHYSTADKLHWKCGLEHQWKANLNSVGGLGTWCPQCATSTGEQVVRALFEGAFGMPFPQSRPPFMRKTKMHLDGYNAGLGVAFEVQGVQHYQYTAQFHRSPADLLAQQVRDRMKADLCAVNRVELIAVPYWVIDEGLPGIGMYVAKACLGRGLYPRHDPLTVDIDRKEIYDKRNDADYLKFKRIVKEKGGRFKNSDYLGKTRKLTVTCAEGHSWKARPYLVMAGHWCPACAKNQPLTFETVDRRLREHGWHLDQKNKQGLRAIEPIRMRCPNDHLVIRSWNKWQQKADARKPTCQQCDRDARAVEFIERMKVRGIAIDIDISTYVGEGQPVTGICQHCARVTVLPVQKWKNRSLTPCCRRSMAAYHWCHENRYAEASA